VGFSGPDRSGQAEVFVALDPLAAGQLEDLRPGNALEGLPVDLLEGLQVGEAGVLEAVGDGLLVPRADLGLEKLLEEVLVRPAVLLGLAAEGRVLPHDGRELQEPAVLLQDGLVRGGGHWSHPSPSRRS
jgi:hypothetical protein